MSDKAPKITLNKTAKLRLIETKKRIKKQKTGRDPSSGSTTTDTTSKSRPLSTKTSGSTKKTSSKLSTGKKKSELGKDNKAGDKKGAIKRKTKGKKIVQKKSSPSTTATEEESASNASSVSEEIMSCSESPQRTLDELHALVLEKQERLKEVRDQLRKTNEERDAIRSRLNEMSLQMEQITEDILQAQEGRKMEQTVIESNDEPVEITVKNELTTNQPFASGDEMLINNDNRRTLDPIIEDESKTSTAVDATTDTHCASDTKIDIVIEDSTFSDVVDA